MPKFKAEAGRTVLAVGPYCWAKAADDVKALRAMKTHKPSFVTPPYPIVFYDGPADVYVDQMGRVCTPRATDTVTELEQRTVTK